MALVKTPDGGFYVDDEQFMVDYEENSITLIGGGGGGSVIVHNNDPDAHNLIELDCGDLG